MKNQKGVSLVELIVVISIIGILSAIALPQYGRFIAKGRVHAAASDLLQVYRLALDNDPQFQAARYQADAGREKEPQGLAGLLPTIGASANTQWNDIDRDLRGSSVNSKAKYNSNGYSVTLTQPLLLWPG